MFHYIARPLTWAKSSTRRTRQPPSCSSRSQWTWIKNQALPALSSKISQNLPRSTLRVESNSHSAEVSWTKDFLGMIKKVRSWNEVAQQWGFTTPAEPQTSYFLRVILNHNEIYIYIVLHWVHVFPGFLSNSIFDMSRFMHSPEWLSSHISSVFSAEWLCFPCWKAITCVSSNSISPKRTQMLSTSNLEHVKPTSTLNCWIIYNSHMSHKKTYPIQPHHVEWLNPFL